MRRRIDNQDNSIRVINIMIIVDERSLARALLGGSQALYPPRPSRLASQT